MSADPPTLCEVGYLQLAPELGAVQENLDRIDEQIEGARADLLVLPELATTGYALRDRETVRELAEPIPGPTTTRLAGAARAIGGHLVVGIAERAGDRLYNSAALIGPGGVLAVYRKAHLFRHEKQLFDPGDTGFPVARLEPTGLRVGLMICFDWAFPEAAGTLARRGAQLVAHPSNLVLPHARRALPIRCLENRVFAITANRYGDEEGPDGPLHFRGESLIVSPRGDVLAAAPVVGDELRTVSIAPADADDKLITPQNHLFDDRRPELYGEAEDD
jgi:predicted amidohydrolase